MLGVEIVSESVCLERDDIGAVLVPGARICFTGTAQDSAGRIVERWEMEQLAAVGGSDAGQVGDEDALRGAGDGGGGHAVGEGAQGAGVRQAGVHRR